MIRLTDPARAPDLRRVFGLFSIPNIFKSEEIDRSGPPIVQSIEHLAEFRAAEASEPKERALANTKETLASICDALGVEATFID